MGLLSPLGFGLQAGYGPGWGDYQRRQQPQQIQYRAAQPTLPPQLPSLTAPMNGQPMGPDPFAPAPVSPPVSAMPQMKQGPVQDPSAPQGFMARLNKGIGNLNEQPLFNLGMALLGNADRGGNWAGVAQDMRGFSQDQMQRQRMENEARRNKTADVRQETQFGWATEAQQREAERRQRYSDWAGSQTDNPLAAVDPEVAFEQEAQARALAGQPLTPFQQAQLNLQRQGLAIDAAQANYALQNPNVSRGDQRTIDTITEASDQANAFNSEITRFLGLNEAQPTGPYTNLNPGSWFGTSRMRRDEMEGITSRLISSVRAMSGEGGIMTDADALRFERGLPSVNRYGPTNQNIASAAREVARNAQDRVAFYENWVRDPRNRGSLLGARSAWNEYLARNPIYTESGDIRSGRLGFEEWMQAGAPDARQQRSALSPAANGQTSQQRAAAPPSGPPPAARARGMTHWNGTMWTRPPQQQRRDFSRDTLR